MKTYLTEVYETLVPLWPDAKPLLHYSSCFELLCAVVLSAQCTDEQVNSVTPRLFEKFPDAHALAHANVEEVEQIIHSVGFFHTKARHLVRTASVLVDKFDGEVPHRMEDLLALPGVGRKTANLVVSACFGTPGIIVDTHVMRVAYRLGVQGQKDPAAIEKTIRDNMDERFFTAFSHALNRHGKFVCTARKPACVREAGSCPVEKICPKLGVEK